jgi:hypothetical protein
MGIVLVPRTAAVRLDLRWSPPASTSRRGLHRDDLSAQGQDTYPPEAMPVKPQSQAPERSLDQRMEALRRANEIRSMRAQLKKDLKSGRASIAEIISSPPDYVATAKVFDLLMAVPKYGKVKATRFLNHCRIAQGKTIGGLTDRQRSELLDLLAK